MKCLLEPDINQCPHFMQENGTCALGSEGKCSFQEQTKQPKPERKERWYEKYYK